MTSKQAASLAVGRLALGVILITDAVGLPEATVPLMALVMLFSLMASYVWR